MLQNHQHLSHMWFEFSVFWVAFQNAKLNIIWSNLSTPPSPICFITLSQNQSVLQIVNTHMDHNSSHARRRGALLTWQHIDSLPSNLPVVYCGGFNALKESRMGRFLLGRSQEHGLSGNLNDAWVSCAQRRNAHLVHTYHGFHGRKWGTKEFLKMLFRAFFLCWDWHNQDLHVDWILFRGSSLSPFLCEIMDDNVAGQYPSDHYPVCCQFTLPRNVRP
jgi:endonuclease/exonuclease/phosphatase family metal-dependent hydrolase